MNFSQIKGVYFVGVGGIGMSALARYFKANGIAVAGYDRMATVLTSELEKEGIDIHFEDDVNKIEACYKEPSDILVIYTPAVSNDHTELNYFRDRGFQIKKRSEVLGILTKERKGICIAGTHGKTTISTMVAHLLKQSDVDCNAFLGGVSKNYRTNLLLSKTSDFVVLEADEYDRSFLQLSPYLALISSVDADHLDVYGDGNSVKQSFHEFASLVKDGGVLLTKKEIDFNFSVKKEVIHYTYSASDQSADFYADNVRLDDGLYIFDLHTKQKVFANIKLGIPALVNVENAVGACACALLVGVSFEELQLSLPKFKGIRRRFDYRIKTDVLVLIDDYAHHPEEITATVKSVRALYPTQKVTGVFQPHLYSRTNDFYKEFASALNVLDELIMLDIYPAREKPMEGVSSQLILDLIDLPIKMISSKDKLFENIMKIEPQILLMMGAGDIDKEIDKVVNKIKENSVI